MKIALASPSFPKSIADGLKNAVKLVEAAAEAQAEIVCFPESYIPGYPTGEHVVEASSPQKMQDALNYVCDMARRNSIAIIMPIDWYTAEGSLNVAYVVDSKGQLLGYQAKTQLDPSEDNTWVPGTSRSLFEVNGVRLGIVICHEGFRYPETVRWAAMRGAKVIFHPHYSGSDADGKQLTEWSSNEAAYYEKAMMMRALENTVYFASVGYATRFQESATAIINPDGSCLAHQPYGKAGILVSEINIDLATGLLAKRFKPSLYTQE